MLRLDSNKWAGQVSQALALGHRPIGYEPLYDSVVGLIPSALYPSKLASLNKYQMNQELWISAALGMPLVDYLPGDVTTFYGALSLSEQLMFWFIVGLVFGFIDRLSLRDAMPGTIILYLVLVECALFFERGLPMYVFEICRTLPVMGAVIWLWSIVRSGRARRTASRNAEDPSRAQFEGLVDQRL